jgi:hypothetical protein
VPTFSMDAAVLSEKLGKPIQLSLRPGGELTKNETSPGGPYPSPPVRRRRGPLPPLRPKRSALRAPQGCAPAEAHDGIPPRSQQPSEISTKTKL